MPAIAKETAEPAQLCSALRSEDSCWAQSRDSPEVPEGNSWAKDTKSHPRNLFALNGPLGFTLSSTSFASLHQQGKETAASPFPLERFPAEGCSPTPRLGRTATPAPLPGDGASTACPEPARLLAIHSGREEPAPGPASAAAPSLPPSLPPRAGSPTTAAAGRAPGVSGALEGGCGGASSRLPAGCVCVCPRLWAAGGGGSAQLPGAPPSLGMGSARRVPPYASPGELRPSAGAGSVPAEGEPRGERGREGTRGSLAVGTVRARRPGEGPVWRSAASGLPAPSGSPTRFACSAWRQGRRGPFLPPASATVAEGTGCPSPGPCVVGGEPPQQRSGPTCRRSVLRDEGAGARPY